jgi:hypothetical protein
MGRRGCPVDAPGLALVVAALGFWAHVFASRAGPTVVRAAARLQGALWAVVVAPLAWHWRRLAR